MNSFNVLQRELDIYKNYLLEASAGTGKTFSIENIVVRLLIENHPENERPLKIEDILVVTFTRAATSELKSRIRKNIESCMNALKSTNPGPFQFLTSILTRGEEATTHSIIQLENALFCFDKAQIHTIHGFCSKMLRENVFEGDLRLDSTSQEQLLPSETRSIVKNFLRTEITPSRYCSEQISIVLKKHSNQYEKFEKNILSLVTQSLPIKKNNSFQTLYENFISAIALLKSEYGFTKQKLLTEYEAQRDAFKKPTGVTDPDYEVLKFAELFDNHMISESNFEYFIKNGLVIYDALHPINMKKKVAANPPNSVHYPNLIKILEQTLYKIISEARCPEMILTNMAHDCQSYLKRYCLEEEKLSFDDFLNLMNQALQHPLFLKNIRNKYTVAIIDEFQDTDPLQWNIFRSLFLQSDENNRYIYLVGDPKQSIYSFRQADIYTYLSAAEVLGDEHIATLDTNFRSQPRLVDALNALFSESNCPEFINLPRTKSVLPYHPIKAGKKDLIMNFDDKLGNIHFFLAEHAVSRSNSFPIEPLETEYFFPFIVQEIQKMQAKLNLHYRQFAILISDRYQGERLSQFLKDHDIPFSLQRSPSLAESLALRSMKEVLQAFLNPTNNSTLKIGLGGSIIGLIVEDILSLDNAIKLEIVIEKIYLLRSILIEKGFTSFFKSLMHSTWLSDETVQERLLNAKGGIEFYDDLIQIAELMMEFESQAHPPPDALITYLHEFDTMQVNDDARIRRRSDPGRDAVTITTMHSSKGLEFDIVFALGSIKRSSQPNKIITCLEGENRVLKAVLSKDDPEYLLHCNEIDAEKLRQFYVAVTRAKHRLYIPYAIVKNSKTQLGCASPTDLFLAKMCGTTEGYSELYERINNFSATILEDFVSNEKYISMEVIDPNKLIYNQRSPDASPTLIPPKKIHISGNDLFMQSFSSLTRNHSTQPIKVVDESPPHNFLEVQQSPHSLPAGSETGNLLHLIFETIDFDCRDIRSHVTKFTHNTKYQEWADCITEIVETALNIDIDGFSLKEVPKENTYRELEFVYPLDLSIPKIEEVETQPGFLKGIIDLIFFHNSKYYILDWKSNWLGSTTASYGQKSMKQSMQEHSYELQAALYTEALKRYLGVVDHIPFEDTFAGTYYIFLRGIGRHNTDREGIYAIAASKEGLCRD